MKKCKFLSRYRFTWPGEKERTVCIIHALKIKELAVQIDCFVEFIEVEWNEDNLCSQTLSKKELELIESL